MYSSPKQSKILLMGPHNGGKTSMRSVIFSNYTPRDTTRLAATIDSQRTQVRFLGNFVLNMWDCGGQVHYLDGYLKTQRQFTFSNVAVLIYAVDISVLCRDDGDMAAGGSSYDYYGLDNEGGEWSKATIIAYLRNVIAALQEHSPEAAVYILLHKSDLVPAKDRRWVVQRLEEEIRAAILPQGGASSLASDPSPLPGPGASSDMYRSPLHDGGHFPTLAHAAGGRSAPTTIDRDTISNNNIHIYGTSIWDESLNDAWSAVFQRLVPNAQRLHSALRGLVQRTDAAEATVFERSTFLAISRVRQITVSSQGDGDNNGISSTGNAQRRTKRRYFTYLDGPDGTSHHREIIYPTSDHDNNTTMTPDSATNNGQPPTSELAGEPQYLACDPSIIPVPTAADTSSAHLSNVFKYFKKACVKATGSDFGEVVLVTEDGSTIVVQGLTANTVVMLVMRGVGPAVVKRNLAIFRDEFARTMESLEAGDEGYIM